MTPATKLETSRQEKSHRFPVFLPDGRQFLFLVRAAPEASGVYAGSLDGKTGKFLLRVDSGAVYVAPGYLLFMNGSTLLGQAFDAGRLELSGQPFTVAEQVGHSTYGYGAFAVSTATLAYAGPVQSLGRLTWFDRVGNPIASLGQEGDYVEFRLSPEENRVALTLVNAKRGFPDIWLADLTRHSTSLFQSAAMVNAAPVWSPDGARLLFRTSRNGLVELYQKSAAGGGNSEPVLTDDMQRVAHIGAFNVIPTDWSPDAANVVYTVTGTGSGYDLWLLPISGDRTPVRFLNSPADEMHGNFSPDGHFLAYTSNETGKYEVYVQTLPRSERRWQVSTSGGYEPRWRRDGREIYYLSEDRKLMAVAVGPGPSFGVPKPLFQTRVPAGVSAVRTNYVPTRDGQRFLINTQTSDPPPNPITVVLNWTAGLKP